jgi:hypothetical protein
MKEGIKINQSLSALSDVLSKLVNGESTDYIPYRNNKLTYLMKDSLGGNSKTLMFVNISPAEINSQETKQSLYFGHNARSITNPIKKNIDSEEVTKLKEEIEVLRK